MTNNKLEQTNGSSADLSPPFYLPLITSLLISESLFPDPDSPAATLIIPLVRIRIPYAYFLIVALDLITALLVKWYYGPTYSLLAPQYASALPDIESLRQIYGRPTGQQTFERQETEQQGVEQQAAVSTPLLPVGMAFNISFSSPFYEPNSKVSTLFTLELKKIRNIPGYLLPVATLLLYIILRPLFLNKQNQNQDNRD